MAKKARKIRVGDRIMLLVPVTSDIVDGMITFEINGHRVTIPDDLEAIVEVKPYNPKSAYDRVR